MTTSDVLGFITEQRGDRGVVRLADGESGLSARTIQRRLSSISGLFGFLLACGEVDANPVPRGLSNRKRSRTGRGTPLVRTPRTLPTILEPAEVDELLGACRRWRDRAMVEAMVFGAFCGEPRSSVCGSMISRSPSVACSSLMARAVISASFRSRNGSSIRSPTTSVTNARRRRRRIGCSWC